ncbi:hypothetical protein QR98_0088630 [Sarcoptes scabiei]|uniref:Uncharacterized protein n=1 Tax=Sarcoptes scabiei TaxID=52283 RepID=A0A132AIM8_SARSC|nr:hypothetical protein QR98_0088630 [Sarcoptes scabiei]
MRFLSDDLSGDDCTVQPATDVVEVNVVLEFTENDRFIKFPEGLRIEQISLQLTCVSDGV